MCDWIVWSTRLSVHWTKKMTSDASYKDCHAAWDIDHQSSDVLFSPELDHLCSFCLILTLLLLTYPLCKGTVVQGTNMPPQLFPIQYIVMVLCYCNRYWIWANCNYICPWILYWVQFFEPFCRGKMVNIHPPPFSWYSNRGLLTYLLYVGRRAVWWCQRSSGDRTWRTERRASRSGPRSPTSAAACITTTAFCRSAPHSSTAPSTDSARHGRRFPNRYRLNDTQGRIQWGSNLARESSLLFSGCNRPVSWPNKPEKRRKWDWAGQL